MCGTPAELRNNANKVEAIKKERFCLYFQLFEEATWRHKNSSSFIFRFICEAQTD